MKIAQAILLIFGLLFLTLSVTNIQTWNWNWESSSGSKSSVILYNGWERLIPLLFALICFAWLLGLLKRRLWAWYLGCTLFIVLMADTLLFRGLLGFRTAASTSEAFWLLFWHGLFAFILFLILKKWWIPKKKYFAR